MKLECKLSKVVRYSGSSEEENVKEKREIYNE